MEVKVIQFYTYLYIDPRTNVPFYVGKGKKEPGYDRVHSRHANKQVIGRICGLKKLGLEHIIEKIHTVNVDSALWLERCFIAAYGRRDQNNGPLLNHTNGGDNPPINKDPEVIKRRTVHLRTNRNPMKNHIIAAKTSTTKKAQGDAHPTKRPEVREKMRLAKLGVKLKFDHAAKVKAAFLKAAAVGGSRSKNKQWITNGILTKRITKDLPIPIGWKSGRTSWVRK